MCQHNPKVLKCEACDLEITLENGLCGSTRITFSREKRRYSDIIKTDDQAFDVAHRARERGILHDNCEPVRLGHAIISGRERNE